MTHISEKPERPDAGTFVGNIYDHHNMLVARVVEVDGRFYLLNINGGIIEVPPPKERRE